MLLVDFFVSLAQLDQTFSRNVGVFFDVVFLLDLVERFFKVFVMNANNHVAEHVDQTTVSVVSESFVLSRSRQTFGRLVVETKVQNGVHHPRHRDGRTRSNRNQQRVGFVAKLLAEFLFKVSNVGLHVIHQASRQSFASFVEGVAAFSGDGESRRNRQSNARHGSEVQTLTAEQCFV